MRAFETSLNGQPLCVAGIDGDGVLTVIIDSVRGGARDELRLAVGGLVSATGEHLGWNAAELQVGDAVQVKVVECASADEPATRKREDPARELEAQKSYVRQMAENLGWTLIEQPN